MYTTINFRSKKALKDAIARGIQVSVWNPGPLPGKIPSEGQVFLEGPHFPLPHKWYAKATLANGLVVKVE